jgi:hypothetical protein
VSQALITAVHFSEALLRARELYASTFKGFFAILQQDPRNQDLAKVGRKGRLDAVLARHLSHVLLQYNLFLFLSGDRTPATQETVLRYLALTSSSRSVTVCTSGLSIHQLMGVRMALPLFYSLGSAICLLEEDATLLWYKNQPQVDFQAQVKKGQIQGSISKSIDAELNPSPPTFF